MPFNDPRVGELWEMRDIEGRAVRGVVADVTSTAITLVSLTGNRSRVPPRSLNLAWAYVSAPRTAYNCARRSCDQQAVFRYYRGQSPEYACARHMPVGTRGELLPDQPDAPGQPSREVTAPTPCPQCTHLEPVEVLADPNATGLDLPPPEASEWTCPLCSARWILIITRPDVNYGTHWQMTALTAARNRAMRQGHEVVSVQTSASTFGVILINEHLEPEVGNAAVLWGDVPLTWSLPLPGVAGSWVRLQLRSRAVTRQTRERVPAANDSMLQLLRNASEEVVTPMDEHEVHRVIVPGTRWVHKGQGQTVEIMEVENGAVAFRADEQSFRMTIEDFLSFHRPFSFDASPAPTMPLPEIAPGEEWTSVEGTVTIVDVNSKREQVSVRWAHGGQKTSRLDLRAFAGDKWRKVIRKTAFQRIMDDEDD